MRTNNNNNNKILIKRPTTCSQSAVHKSIDTKAQLSKYITKKLLTQHIKNLNEMACTKINSRKSKAKNKAGDELRKPSHTIEKHAHVVSERVPESDIKGHYQTVKVTAKITNFNQPTICLEFI